MKVIHVIPNYFPQFGGSVKTVSDFLKAFPNSEVISFDTKILTERLPFDHLVHHIKTGPCLWHKDTHFLCKEAKKKAEDLAKKADLIFCHQLFRAHNHWVKNFCHKHKIPYVVVPHGAMDPWVFTYRALRKKIWYRLFGHKFLEDASFVLTATKREAEKMNSRYHGKNITTVFWPTETVAAKNKKQDQDDLRKKLNLPPKTRLLLFIGRFDPCKRIMELIEIFAKAKTKQTHLVIAGVNFFYTEQELQQKINETKSSKVHLLGPHYGEEKNNLYSAVDGYISLSHKENFSYTAAEALAAGLPLLLSPGHDLAGDLEPDLGWFLKTNKEEEVLKAIEKFDQVSQEKLEKMGKNSRKWADENLVPSRFQLNMKKLVQKTLGREV